MKKKLLLFCFILLTSIVSAQGVYENGYYINSKGVKKEGSVKIIDFDKINQLETLDFKDNEGKVEKLQLETIAEIVVGNELKLQKATVQMDDVSFSEHFNHDKNLDLKRATLFLNVLVEGNAKLYSIDNGNGKKFFYNVLDNEIKQLAYKRYEEEGVVKENTAFRKDLFNDIQCGDQQFNDFIELKHEKNELVSIFQKYNTCKGSTDAKVYGNKFEKKLQLKFTGFAGICIFDPSDTGFGFGGELEVLLPSERVAFYAKLGYEGTSGSFETNYYTVNTSSLHHDTYDFDAKSVDLTGGLRYYIPILQNHKFFINAGFGVSSQFGDITYVRSITNGGGTFTDEPITERLRTSMYFTGGIGYVFKNKFGLAVTYDGDKRLFEDYISDYQIRYSKIAIDLRYTFN